jgi:hypothetical protein
MLAMTGILSRSFAAPTSLTCLCGPTPSYSIAGKKSLASGKEFAPASSRSWSRIDSSSISSSNREGRTTAAAPARSSRERLSSRPVNGDAEATSGDRRRSPR